MRRQDRFRDWNWYHKSVVFFIGGCVAWTVMHAIFVYDRAFKQEDEVILPVNAEALWPWIVDDDYRSNWYAELIDVSSLNGDKNDLGATRLLFWRRGYKRWHTLETVTDLLKGRLFVSEQEGDHEKRWFKLELMPISSCETKVHIEEIIYPSTYEDRFWFFTNRADHQERLAVSLDALDRWTRPLAETCREKLATGEEG